MASAVDACRVLCLAGRDDRHRVMMPLEVPSWSSTSCQVRAKIQQDIRPHEGLLTVVKRRKLQCYGHVSRSSGLAKTILQGTVKGGSRQGRLRKRWEDNIREWTGQEFPRVPEGSGEKGKMEKTGRKIICGAPTTLAVKGLMMMMMNFNNDFHISG